MNKNHHLEVFAALLSEELSELELTDLATKIGIPRFDALMEGREDWSKEEIGIVAEFLDEFPQDLILQHRIGWSTITLEEISALVAPDGLEIGVVAHAA